MYRKLLAVCALCLAAPSAQAATLYIDRVDRVVGRGDSEVLQIRIDTDEAQEECINAVSGVLAFTGPVTPIDVSTGKSILPLWIETPTIQSNNNVTFAGGMPNGYCGRVEGDPQLTNVLFEVVVRTDIQPATSGEIEAATVSFTEQTAVYLNDGFGTLASLRTLPATIDVSPNASTIVSDPWITRVGEDTRPPQPFSISLQQEPRAFDGQYYISFNTTDKETGIDHYEVMEEPIDQIGAFLWGRADAPWLVTRSPYVIQDQTLNSIIRVKAIDKAGNEYISNLVPDEELRGLSSVKVMTYVSYSVLIVLLGALGLY